MIAAIGFYEHNLRKLNNIVDIIRDGNSSDINELVDILVEMMISESNGGSGVAKMAELTIGDRS